MSARTAFWAPVHRLMGRMPTGSGAAAQPPLVAPSLDCAGSGIQDARLPWNSGNTASSPSAIGWYTNNHPVLDVVPATLSAAALAASQVPVAGVPLTLVSSSAAGVVVSSSAWTAMPSGNTIAAGSVFIDSVPVYQKFGASSGEAGNTWFYDAATMLSRAVKIHSAGDDTGAIWTVVGYDIYGYPLTATIAGVDTADATVLKCFKVVTSITPSGTLSGSAVTAGTTDVFGLPLYAAGASALWGYWNSIILAGLGTFTAGVTTNPSTAALGDVRGKYLPASAADGSKRLTLYQRPSLANMVANGINPGMFGMTQV
jgi:hypothetical protein